MTDLEISRALALAIGWKPEDIRCTMTTVFVMTRYHGYFPFEEIFSYYDWDVIGPIAEKFDCFPARAYAPHTGWCARVKNPENWTSATRSETPQKAIALAVIKGAEK